MRSLADEQGGLDSAIFHYYLVMVVVQASKLKLPQISSLSSPEVSSLLFDPHSLSLALMHSDSSFSLYPSVSPLSLSSPSLPPPQALIPAPSSSATFLRLQSPNPNSPPRYIFIVASPLQGGAAVLLRFFILRPSSEFSKARVVCNQSGLRFDDSKSGVVFSVKHGVSVKLAGSINVFTLYSVSNCKLWVFAVRTVDDEDDGVTVKLMKCAAIDCSVPVFSISVSSGVLILGEQNGVRIFALRPLVKGRVKKHRRETKNLSNGLNNDKLEGQRLKLANGVTQTINGANILCDKLANHLKYGGKRGAGEGTLGISCNGYLEGKIEKHSDSVKLRSVKLRQDSKEVGACFVAFGNKDVQRYKSSKLALQSAKAISIQALSLNKFLILDSTGDLHLLCLSNAIVPTETSCHVKQLTKTMKVQKLAVLPDVSIRAQTVWTSDGCHTVHMLAVPDMDASVGESGERDFEEKLTQISVTQAIFASERIQDIVPLAPNAILILGQGSLFSYAIS